MKNPLILIIPLLVAGLSACGINPKSEEERLQDWVRTAEKPIVVRTTDEWRNTKYKTYTLIAADGTIYITKRFIPANLPDTIKTTKSTTIKFDEN